MRSAFARAMELRMPEPWGPVKRATSEPPAPSGFTTARRKCRNRGPSVMGSPTHTGTVRRKGRGWPSSLRSTGRTNSSNVTIVLTGFPGNPSLGFVDVRDLVSGPHERDPRRAVHQRGAVGDRGEHPELGGAKCGARRQRDVALPDILAAAADVLPGIPAVAHRDAAVVEQLDVLLADHAVGASGERRAGEDPGGLARADGLCGESPGGHCLDHR